MSRSELIQRLEGLRAMLEYVCPGAAAAVGEAIRLLAV
jgi:hypothetical protein